ncbi:MAG: histidine ammonia-lyase [Steroidobacteraceae bacterium]
MIGKTSTLAIDGRSLGLTELAAFESRRPEAVLAPGVRERLLASRAVVERAAAQDAPVYGINTGFGAFANRKIPPEHLDRLQLNLVRSHAAGVGEALDAPLTRRLMLLKANGLAGGFSGVRPEVVDALLALVNADVLPVIPRTGSVGASGDLAPLAHLALALIGEGEARCGEKALAGPAVMQASGRSPLVLTAKEGLALLNGTQLSAALAVEGCLRVDRLLRSAIVAGALSVDALAGSYAPFDARIHAARGQRGQIEVARRLRDLLTDSAIKRSHADCDRVQDPYAVRCMPQVMGALWDTLTHARGIVEIECNAATDNPLVLGDDIISGGNFHAAPLGYVCDFLAIGLADCAGMAERRIDLLDRRVNPNLNLFLAGEPGLESGFMIAHVTSAALASANKTLAHPASVDTVPTSAGQEDHVSMAPWAAEKLLAICDNTEKVLAIELLAAAHAIDSMRPLTTTPQLQAIHGRIRREVPFDRADHRLDRDIARLAAAVHAGVFADSA